MKKQQDVLYENAQWTVTKFGIEFREFEYFVPSDELAEEREGHLVFRIGSFTWPRRSR